MHKRVHTRSTNWLHYSAINTVCTPSNKDSNYDWYYEVDFVKSLWKKYPSIRLLTFTHKTPSEAERVFPLFITNPFLLIFIKDMTFMETASKLNFIWRIYILITILRSKSYFSGKPALKLNLNSWGVYVLWAYGVLANASQRLGATFVFYFKFKYLNSRLPGLYFLAFALCTTCGMLKLTGPASACFNKVK